MARNNLALGAEKYSKAIEADASHAAAHLALGYAQVNQKQLGNATVSLERALTLGAPINDVLVALARSAPTDAALLKRFNALANPSAKILVERARVALLLNNTEQAVDDASNAKIARSSEASLVLAWALMCQKKSADAKREFLLISESFPLAHLGLAFIASSEQNRTETINHLTLYQRHSRELFNRSLVANSQAFLWLKDDAAFLAVTKEN